VSLYNVVCGTNQLARVLLAALRLPSHATGRFRDCYLQRDAGGALEIHVYTRNGGGNRPDFADVTKFLRQHPLFLRDFDDPSDSTYASYVFALPDDQHRSAFEAVAKAEPAIIPPPPHERMKAFIDRMDSDPNDPEVVRVREAMRPTIEQLERAMNEAGLPPSSTYILEVSALDAKFLDAIVERVRLAGGTINARSLQEAFPGREPDIWFAVGNLSAARRLDWTGGTQRDRETFLREGVVTLGTAERH
jgi:hypothetical protein